MYTQFNHTKVSDQSKEFNTWKTNIDLIIWNDKRFSDMDTE